MNEGHVLLSSTNMLSAGVNVQRRAVTIHHLDISQRPSELAQRDGRTARQAIENDMHVAGESFLTAWYKTLMPTDINELKKLGREYVLVYVGGAIPHQDYQFLRNAGTAVIFGPGTKDSKNAIQILEILLELAKKQA